MLSAGVGGRWLLRVWLSPSLLPPQEGMVMGSSIPPSCPLDYPIPVGPIRVARGKYIFKMHAERLTGLQPIKHTSCTDFSRGQRVFFCQEEPG